MDYTLYCYDMGYMDGQGRGWHYMNNITKLKRNINAIIIVVVMFIIGIIWYIPKKKNYEDLHRRVTALEAFCKTN